MPYVNIPESKLVSTIASLVGKIQGDVIGKVIKKPSYVEGFSCYSLIIIFLSTVPSL